MSYSENHNRSKRMKLNVYSIVLVSLLITVRLSEQSTWHWSCRDNTGITFFPSPDDCNTFYKCNREELSQAWCPPGEIFDVFSRRCGNPESSTCFIDLMNPTTTQPTTTTQSTTTTTTPLPTTTTPSPTTTTPTTTTTTTTIPTTTTTSTATTPTTTATTPTTTTTTTESPTEPAVTEPRCPLLGLHFFPHPTDCRRFFACVIGHLNTIMCPMPRRWNQALGRCDSPENVQCDQS
ncbi:mucin-2-like [Wyeomyia smithii]|uniref:mucin-2-like n=1 Tax=Wyeomyia smithii TaxID=174621 RepID=UPI0024680D9E|nr:mucin-2-like [Wyeomyia smithii]